jgi:TolB-like protein/DNA-binding winged helix-turn-helix (wHTH) protein/Tfp pilus assembly protein PilF
MLAAAPASRVLRFDNFELDIRVGELRKAGVKLRLQGQPIQVLGVLLNSAGELVTREQLRAQVWPADTFVDFDHSLHNTIARIREVLGDSAERPRYIETLPRRGYRYIGPVADLQTPQPATETGHHASGPLTLITAPKRKRILVMVLGALVFVALFALGLVASTTWRYLHPKAAVLPIQSLAVLPLDNLSGDPSEEFFADGMTDQLITDLAKVRSLRIISRTSVMRYKGAKKSLPAIARELNVDAIVEGSVIRSGPRVRVTAQLIRASTDQHVWAETYDRDLGDILNLQGEVADAIAQQVRAQLTPSQQSQLRLAHVVNPAAYDDYLRGRLYFTNEFTKPESLRKAQHYFEDAIRKDPSFALAYAGLADTYVYLAYAGVLQKDRAYRSARNELAKAVQLDDSIGEVHDTLGVLSSFFDWDWETADREFNRAIALAPSYSCAHEDRAVFLALVGRRAESLAEIAKVEQLDYSFSAANTESWAYYHLRDYPRLIDSSRRALLFDPTVGFQHFSLGVGYEGTGKLQEAIVEYQKAIETSDGSPGPTVALAHAYAAAGKKAEAEKMLRALENNSKVTASAYTAATVYAGLGENDKAFEFLEKARAQKSFQILLLKSDLLLDALRPDPRFQDLLHRMNLN